MTRTTRSGPGAADPRPGRRPEPGLDAVMSERRQLINLSYRMLGSLAEAEDAVQEAYARWYALSADQRGAIESPGAWLTTVASRICLTQLTSARARRETYVGQWLAEPLPGRPGGAPGAEPAGPGADPADRVTLDESVSMAFGGGAGGDDAGRAGGVRPARRVRLPVRRHRRGHRPQSGGLPAGPGPAAQISMLSATTRIWCRARARFARSRSRAR